MWPAMVSRYNNINTIFFYENWKSQKLSNLRIWVLTQKEKSKRIDMSFESKIHTWHKHSWIESMNSSIKLCTDL